MKKKSAKYQLFQSKNMSIKSRSLYIKKSGYNHPQDYAAEEITQV